MILLLILEIFLTKPKPKKPKETKEIVRFRISDLKNPVIHYEGTNSVLYWKKT